MYAFKRNAIEYFEKQGTLRESCIEFIKNRLSKSGGRISLIDKDGYSAVCVTYDGGNHPEMYAYPYSDVYDVYLDDEEIKFTLDETDDYPIDSVSTDELYEVCDFILRKKR